MSLAEFLALQNEIWWAFGWLARWWLIIFAAMGTALSVLLFVLSIVTTWLDNR
jgi:hypothetical protein